MKKILWLSFAVIALCGGVLRAQTFDEQAPFFAKQKEIRDAQNGDAGENEALTDEFEDLKVQVGERAQELAQAKANGKPANEIAQLETMVATLKAQVDQIAPMAAASNAKYAELEKEEKRVETAIQENGPPYYALYNYKFPSPEEMVKGFWEGSSWYLTNAHVIATAQVRREGKPALNFRYDGFPGVERVVGEDGVPFVRIANKRWMKSTDWGKTGTPAPDERCAELDAMAELVRRPLQPVAPDPQEGAVVWKGGHFRCFEQTREKPAAGTVYPVFGFGQSGAQLVMAGWKWREEPAHETICYSYQDEKTPRAGDGAWSRPLEALRAAAAKPVNVNAVICGATTVRLAGTMSGRNFDFTIADGDKTSRQIAVGDKSWVSMDDGKTWQEQKETDREYFDMVRFPLDTAADAVLLSPYDQVVAAGSEGVETQWTFGAVAARDSKGLVDLQTWRVAVKDGKAVALRSFEGSFKDADGNYAGPLHAGYSDAPASWKALPPPGGHGMVVMPRPDEVLKMVATAMKGEVWRVRRYSLALDTDGNGAWDGEPIVSGLISGGDFDETSSRRDERMETVAMRRIGVGGNAWHSTDGGATWKEEADWVPSLVLPGQLLGVIPATEFYEVVGTEKHGDETWLHICLSRAAGETDHRWHFWLLLDTKGRATCVRRCAWRNPPDIWKQRLEMVGGTIVGNYNGEDFVEAKKGEEIKLPAAAGK